MPRKENYKNQFRGWSFTGQTLLRRFCSIFNEDPKTNHYIKNWRAEILYHDWGITFSSGHLLASGVRQNYLYTAHRDIKFNLGLLKAMKDDINLHIFNSYTKL